MSAHRAVIVFVVMLAILGAAVLFAMFAVRRPVAAARSSTLLVYDVPYLLEEADPPTGTGLLDLVRRQRPTVWTIVHGIRRAARDDRIEGLVLHIDGIEWGWAKVAEIRDAIADFHASGKPVYASLAGGGEREYLLASAAGTIASPPLAVLQLDGLTASALFLRGTFDKLDVSPNFASVGRYKSGVERWTRTGMSPETREALRALVDDHFALFADSVAAARGMAAAEVGRHLDEGPFSAGEAFERGLIDTVLHRAELDSLATDDDRLSTMPLARYVARLERTGGAPRIALVNAVGAIAEGRSRGDAFDGQILGAETLIRSLREARSRSAVRAIVLRIDSPGGSAQAADEIWAEVMRCRNAKPLIVSMSDLAASGGYYIAVPADSIVAHPGTLTGSIGVFGGKLNVLGLYRKLGLNVETVSRGRSAEMLSPFRDFSPAEAERFRSQMDIVYRTFLERVSQGRSMPPSLVDSVGAGRVWTGSAAATRGLVDALGGFERAFAMARARAGIEPDVPVTVEIYPRIERTFLQRVLANFVGDDDENEESGIRGALPPIVRAWLVAAAFPTGQALALMPWSIDVR
jgi:protease-4